MSFAPSRNNYGSINAERVPSVGYSGSTQTSESARTALELTEALSSRIFQLNSERSSLEQWQKNLGTPKDSQELRCKIQNAETSISESVKDGVHELDKLNKLARSADKTMKLQISKLTENFKETVTLCGNAQKLTLEKLRKTYLPSEVALIETKLKDAPFLRGGYTFSESDEQARVATKSLQFETGLLIEREERIATIEKNMIDINQIMNEIGALVHKQAEDINSIENAIEDTHQNVELAQQELEKAVVYKTQRRKKNCFLLAIALIVVLILVLIIAISLH